MKKNRLFLYNGNILPVHKAGSMASWLLAEDGRIIQTGVGTYDLSWLQDSTAIDLRGETVIPGLIDSHVHLVETALNEVSNSLDRCETMEGLLHRIRKAHVEQTQWGDMLHFNGLESSRLAEKRLPTRFDLDSAVKDKLVWVSSVEYHISVVNTICFRRLDLPYNLEGIQRDETGTPTGVLTGRANFYARRKLLGITSDKTRDKGVKGVLKRAVEKGVTTINAMEGGFLFHDRDALYVHRNRERMPIDVELFYQTTDVENAVAMGLSKVGGCIFVDGSFSSHTAALDYPYTDRPETSGTLYFQEEEVLDFVCNSMKHHLTVTMHAIGTRAIRQVLNAYRLGRKAFPHSAGILRIEHFELPNPDLIDEAVMMNVILSMQPAYEYFWGGPGNMYEERLGIRRRKRTNPFRTLLEHGCVIAGGSDSDVTPIDPLLGVHAAVNHPTETERISVMEALKMFTCNGAKAIGQADQKGIIAPGYLADLCVLGHNPLTVSHENLKEIPVTGTIKAGRIIHGLENRR